MKTNSIKKCPVCSSEHPTETSFCPACGWDLNDKICLSEEIQALSILNQRFYKHKSIWDQYLFYKSDYINNAATNFIDYTLKLSDGLLVLDIHSKKPVSQLPPMVAFFSKNRPPQNPEDVLYAGDILLISSPSPKEKWQFAFKLPLDISEPVGLCCTLMAKEKESTLAFTPYSVLT